MKRTKKINTFVSDLEGMINHFQDLHDKKEESYNNRSEKWQESDAGEQAQTEIQELEDIISELESGKDSIESTFEAED